LGWRVVLTLVLAALMICDVLVLMYWSIFTNLKLVTRIPAWTIFTTGFLVIVGTAGLVIMIESYKAIYDSEAVEIRCAIPLLPALWIRQTGRMLRSDIAAKRNVSIFWPNYVLYPKDRHQKKLAIWVPKEDDYFRDWIAGIPDMERRLFWGRRKPNRKP
jgi:hypothetical protein